MYGEPALTGGRLPLGPGRYEAAAGDLDRLDAVRSLTVADGHQAVLCDSDRATAAPPAATPACAGSSGRGEHAVVGGDLDGKVSLVAVGGPAVTAADGAALAGAVQSFGPGVHQAAAGQLTTVGNDAISSLRVAAGQRVLACADDQVAPARARRVHAVRLRRARAGRHRPRRRHLPARRVGRPGAGQVLTAYADGGYKGATATFGPGIFTAADLAAVGNDAVSSLRVAEGGRAVLCEQRLGASKVGACRLFAKATTRPSARPSTTTPR